MDSSGGKITQSKWNLLPPPLKNVKTRLVPIQQKQGFRENHSTSARDKD
jgi:hypothetical protein